ncbi:MAG: hypothetical protein ACOVKO_00370 [Elstera sp.]
MVSSLTVTSLQRAQQTLDRALARIGTGQIETSSTVNRALNQSKADLAREIATQQSRADTAAQDRAKSLVQADAFGEAQVRYQAGANIIQSSIRDDSSVRERQSAVVEAQKLYDSIDPLYGNSLYQGSQVAFREQDYRIAAPTGVGSSDNLSPSDRIFFAANDGVGGFELWSTLGTPGSEIAVGDINVGPAGQFTAGVKPQWAAANGLLYYTATTAASGTELWRSDGTKNGTFLLSDLTPGAASSTISNLTEFNGSLYFTLSEGADHYLYKSDGRAADTIRLGKVATGAAPKSFTVAGDNLYFVSQTATDGIEIRRTDGTISGTQLVTNIRAGALSSFPEYLTASGDKIFFSAIGDTGGRELYVADETGARLVADINPGAADGLPISPIMFIQAVEGGVVYTAQSPSNGLELYFSDGTSATRLTDLTPGPTDTPFGGATRVAAVGDKVAVAATTVDGFYTPYLTDLAGNVQRIFSDDGDALTFASNFTAAGDYIYLRAAEAGSAGSRLYRVDTATATATAIAGTQDLPLTNQTVFGDQVVATALKSGIQRTFLYGPDGLYEVPGLVSQGFAVLVPGITTERLAQSAQTLRQAATDAAAARQAALLAADRADIFNRFYAGNAAIAEDSKQRLTAANLEDELKNAQQASVLVQTGSASLTAEAQAGSFLAGALQNVRLSAKAEADDLQSRREAKLDEARRQQRRKELRGETSKSVAIPSTAGLSTVGLTVESSRDTLPPQPPAYRPVVIPYSLSQSASA